MNSPGLGFVQYTCELVDVTPVTSKGCRLNTSALAHIAGIDFGTSNSSVGLFRNGTPELLDVAGQGRSIPSAIFYASEATDISFGKHALVNYTEDVEGRLLRSLKSVLGTSLMKETTRIRNRRVAFDDIIGDFFGFLKGQLDKQRETETQSVILGRPVHFVDDDPERDQDAQRQLHDIAAKAGFRHIEFQYEPIAAALNYESTLNTEALVLIVDIGGGTADFSVVRASPARHTLHDRSDDVLGNMGVHIGGTDFDRLLSLHRVMPDLGFGTRVKNSDRLLPGSVYFDLATWHRIPLLYDPQCVQHIKRMRLDAADATKVDSLAHIVEHRLGHALARAVEQAKITLSTEMTTTLRLEEHATVLVDCFVERTDMEQSISASVDQLTACVNEGLLQAGVSSNDIACVFYTGGSSSVPCLQAAFKALLPRAVHTRGDLFGSVGLGLAIDAARRFA